MLQAHPGVSSALQMSLAQGRINKIINLELTQELPQVKAESFAGLAGH
jgi:hypothetical protein